MGVKCLPLALIISDSDKVFQQHKVGLIQSRLPLATFRTILLWRRWHAHRTVATEITRAVQFSLRICSVHILTA